MNAIQLGIVTPLLDKLKNNESHLSNIENSFYCDISHFRQSVVKDVEFLLNERKQCLTQLSFFVNAQHSVIQYGIDDFSRFYSSVEEAKSQICKSIKEAVVQFEPRLDQVSVEPEPSLNSEKRLLSIRISGILKTGSINEPIALNTQIDPSDLSLTVTGAN